MALDVLVTGGGGALGSAIVAELRSENMNVCAVGHTFAENIDAVWDIAKETAPAPDCSARIVIHAAAAVGSLMQPLSDAAPLFDTNVTGTLRVAQWCLEKKVKHLIYISGAIVYGDWKNKPKSESDALEPWAAGPYAASKWCGEQAALGLQRTDCAVTILRLSSLYGANYTRGLIPRMLREVRTNGSILLLPPFEDAIDLLHVQDAARTICKVAEQPRSGVWNIGSGELTHLETIATVCARTENAHVVRQALPPSRAPRILNWVDDRAARRDFAHTNRVSLEKGIAEIAARLT